MIQNLHMQRHMCSCTGVSITFFSSSENVKYLIRTFNENRRFVTTKISNIIIISELIIVKRDVIVEP